MKRGEKKRTVPAVSRVLRKPERMTVGPRGGSVLKGLHNRQGGRLAEKLRAS